MADCNRVRVARMGAGASGKLTVFRALRGSEFIAIAAAKAARTGLVAGAIFALSACAGQGPGPGGTGEQLAAPPPQGGAIGSGRSRSASILPLSAPGNAGLVAQSMKNSAELALAEFNAPNIQLLVKDDGGTSLGAQQATQAAINEGAEIILGPLFAQSVQAAGQVARTRGVPVIAFSTDTSAAARGVNLLSFLPESDVNRIVNYAFATANDRSPRWCRTMPMARWSKPRSRKRWRGAAAASWRSSAMSSTRPACRRRSRRSRRPPIRPTRS